jgi:hypothetical protein
MQYGIIRQDWPSRNKAFYQDFYVLVLVGRNPQKALVMRRSGVRFSSRARRKSWSEAIFGLGKTLQISCLGPALEWKRPAQRGSHRHFSHPDRSGVVTVAGNLGDEVPRGTLASI